MDEGRARFIQVVINLVTAIALIGGGIWTVYTYFSSREHEAKIAAIEARKPFEAKRLELYIEAASVAAVATSGKDTKEVKKAKDQFWYLYWGPLAVVEDQMVSRAMVKLGACMQDKTKCDKDPRQLALDLSRTCRVSIAGSWDVYLPDDAVTYYRLEQLRTEPKW
jgi:hypothetical protein